MDVVLLPGDGIGKEISESVIKIDCLLNTNINFIKHNVGADYYEVSGKQIEEGTLDDINRCGLALKGPTATPIGKGFRSINVMLRQEFKTYANLRPVKSIEGVKSRYDDVDLVIVRENSEDLYKGVEEKISDNEAHSIKIITKEASKRICEFAFDYAVRHNRKKVTCMHKANIMKLSDGLFLDTFNEVAKNYPDIKSDSVIIDALCMKLVTDPSNFDVLVGPNLYGDIISDLCAGLVGGLGFAPSCNIGDKVRIYEAVHGSAPDIAGKGIANPTSLLLSYAMLLDDLGLNDKANILKDAIYKVIKEGKHTTIDIGGSASTIEYTKAIMEKINGIN